MIDDEDSAAVRAERAGGAPVIEVDDLWMRYGTRDVLAGVDLVADRGEVVALLGANGAGKTTTIEILEGFRERSSGQLRVLGVDPARGDQRWRSRLGIVLQSWRDHGKWKVRELLEHLGRYYTAYSSPDRARPRDVDALLSAVGLTDRADARIASLSGGERRRLDVAIGVIGRPEVLFLDEPTAGLDPVARREFHELVSKLAEVEDTTVLLTTHDLDEAEKLADRILILDGGQIVADGSAATLTRSVSGQAEVRWRRSGEQFTQTTSEATAFVRELFAQHGDEIADLEVRRATLEDTYMAMVRHHESGGPTPAIDALETEVTP